MSASPPNPTKSLRHNAKTLGITMPLPLLGRADGVME
jgi:hypothetical protein